MCQIQVDTHLKVPRSIPAWGMLVYGTAALLQWARYNIFQEEWTVSPIIIQESINMTKEPVAQPKITILAI